jgi:hypothetical protein
MQRKGQDEVKLKKEMKPQSQRPTKNLASLAGLQDSSSSGPQATKPLPAMNLRRRGVALQMPQPERLAWDLGKKGGGNHSEASELQAVLAIRKKCFSFLRRPKQRGLQYVV